jgi:hypothetical protein
LAQSDQSTIKRTLQIFQIDLQTPVQNDLKLASLVRNTDRRPPKKHVVVFAEFKSLKKVGPTKKRRKPTPPPDTV